MLLLLSVRDLRTEKMSLQCRHCSDQAGSCKPHHRTENVLTEDGDVKNGVASATAPTRCSKLICTPTVQSHAGRARATARAPLHPPSHHHHQNALSAARATKIVRLNILTMCQCPTSSSVLWMHPSTKNLDGPSTTACSGLVVQDTTWRDIPLDRCSHPSPLCLWHFFSEPFHQVQHIDIANWKPRTGSNEFPLPRRATMMVAQGEGNSSKYWLFGGIGVIPGQPAPVSVLRDVGICSVSGGQGRLSSCDSDNDGQFDDFCDQGSKCLASNLPNGGCGEQGACTGVTGTQITLEYLNDMWSYDPIKMMWTRYWAMSTRPTHRAFHSMVIIDELIAIYGGLSPFCYEYCKDVWILNITKGEWQSDKYQRGGTGSGTGDEVLDAKLTGKSITRPLTWSYGNPEDPLWKLHAFNDGYRYEEYGERSRVPGSEGVGGRPFPTAQQHPGKVLPPYDPKYLIPERRYQHVAVAWKQAGRWDMTNWSDYQRDSAGNVEPCRNYSQPIFNLTVGYTGPQPMSNYTPYLCNRTYGKYVWRRPHRWMIIYAGYGGAKKTADITVQKQTYYLSDTWKYDLDTMLWYKMDPYLRSGKAPGERYGHSAVMYVDTMYVFGGRRNFAPVQFTDFVYEPNKLVYNDIWGYNIPNNTWFLVTPTPNNERPHERHGQRAVLWEDIMIVFGGYYDPVQYYQDVWHYNITSNIWRNKHVNGLIPANRMQYGVAMWNKLMVFFGGYGSDCTLINTGSPGVYCRPDGPAYYLGDTWHYDLTICPNGCVGNGTCHYGSCICGPGSDGLDCSNFTCPDCTSMVADPMQSMPCELWDSNEQPVTLIQNPDPYNPVTEWHHIGGPGLPVELSNLTVLDGNCYYDFGIQEKVCRDCSLRGQCDNPTGNCVCDPMFSNFDCSYMACPHPLCNNGGVCLLSGRCVCRYAFFEMDCSINFECPGDCSYQGMCEPGGVCRCYEGFYGVDCSIAIATSGADAVAATSKLYMLLLASAVTWWTCQTQGP